MSNARLLTMTRVSRAVALHSPTITRVSRAMALHSRASLVCSATCPKWQSSRTSIRWSRSFSHLPRVTSSLEAHAAMLSVDVRRRLH